MSLDGNLEDFPLTDVLQLILMGERSGMLEIESDHRSAVIYFDKGQAVHAMLDDFSGEAAVFEVFNWKEGTFAFQTDVGPPIRTITMDCHNLILEAVRRLDEWVKIRDIIPSNDYVVSFSVAHEDLASRVTLGAVEWKIISQVNGATSVKEIAEKVGIGEFETALVIYNLTMSGLLEVFPLGTAEITIETLAEARTSEAVESGSEVSILARFINGLLDNLDYPDGLYNAIRQDKTLVERIDLLAERFPEVALISVNDDDRFDSPDLDGKIPEMDELSKKNLIVALAEVKEQIYRTAETQSNKIAAARRHDKVLNVVFGGREPTEFGLGDLIERKSGS
jgi:hypothetical protein